LPIVNEANISSGKYKIEAETVQLNYKLWKALNNLVLQRGRPIPATKSLLPKIVRQWNLSKGMVDVISRYLRHLNIPFSEGSPSFVLLMRFLLLPAINACLTARLRHTDDQCRGATSFVHYKKQMANALSLKKFVRELAEHFRLKMRDQGGRIDTDPRTHFTPQGSGRKRNNELLYEASESDMADFETTFLDSKRNNAHLDSVKFFVEVPVAKRVRLDRQQGHMCVHLHGRSSFVFDGHADCDSSSEQREPTVKGRCALCGMNSCTHGCTVCRVRLCVEVRDDDTRRSCAEIWHDPNCDLQLQKTKLRRKIADDGTGQEQRITADQQSRRITMSETPIQRLRTDCDEMRRNNNQKNAGGRRHRRT
jgi:hypothetical protein